MKFLDFAVISGNSIPFQCQEHGKIAFQRGNLSVPLQPTSKLDGCVDKRGNAGNEVGRVWGSYRAEVGQLLLIAS